MSALLTRELWPKCNVCFTGVHKNDKVQVLQGACKAMESTGSPVAQKHVIYIEV